MNPLQCLFHSQIAQRQSAAELNKQLEEHERLVVQQQKDMARREQLRQQRQREEEQRLAMEKEKLGQMDRERLEQNRAREHDKQVSWWVSQLEGQIKLGQNVHGLYFNMQSGVCQCNIFIF